MSWDNFAESFIHTEGAHLVLGHRLQPFALHHQFWLETIGSPVMNPGTPVQIVHLEVAARICACRYGEIQRKAIRRPTPLGRLGFALRAMRCDQRKEVAAFDAYIDDYVKPPERHDAPPRTSDGRVVTDFPPALSVASALMKWGFEGGNREAIWSCPVGEAHWWVVSFMRLEGANLKLVTEHDREFMEGLRKLAKDKGVSPSLNKDEGDTGS